MKTGRCAEILPTLIGLDDSGSSWCVLRLRIFDFLSGLLEKPASFNIPAQIVPVILVRAWYPARRQPVFYILEYKPPAPICRMMVSTLKVAKMETVFYTIEV